MEDNSTLTVIVVALIAALFGWGNMVIVPAFPSMALEFGIPVSSVALVMAFYALPGIAMSPVYGVLSDRIGRRKILQPVLVMYNVTAIGAALAPDFTMLLVFRFLQGIVVAAFFPLAFIILGDLFQGETRSRAVSRSFIVIGIISILTPFIGGWLTVISWRLNFLSFGISLPLMGAVYYLVPETHPSVYQTSSISIKPQVNPLTEGDSQTHDPVRSPETPSFPLPAFQVSWKAITGVMLVGLCYFFLIFGAINLFRPLYVELGLGLTSVETGIWSSAQNLFTTLAVIVFGGIVATRSKPWILLIGFLIIGAGSLFLTLPPFIGWMWISTLIIGLGKGIANPVMNSYTLDLTSPAIRGRVTALFQSMARIGQSAGPFLFSTLYVLMGAWLALPFLLGSLMCGFAVIMLLPLIQYTNRTGQGKS